MAGTLAETREVHCITDFLRQMPMVSGEVALCQRLARRLSTPRGRLTPIGWPNYGTDLLSMLLSNVTPEEMARRARVECEKDEQVRQANVLVQYLDTGGVRRARVDIMPVTADGPFPFTMTISEAAETLIELRKAA